MPKANAVFAIDGFEISATFAESQNTAAIGQIKQILLSSFVAQTSSTRPGVILVKPYRTTPAVFSLANPSVNAQTIFSFSAVMAFHEALTSSKILRTKSLFSPAKMTFERMAYIWKIK